MSYKLDKENLSIKDKTPCPNVSFIRRFHCTYLDFARDLSSELEVGMKRQMEGKESKSSQKVVPEVVEGFVVTGTVANCLPEVELCLLQTDHWETAQVVVR